MHHVFAVSDGSGATAEQVLNAALTQFRGAPVEIKRLSRVRTVQRVRQVVREAAQVSGCIVRTLVLDELREEMLREGRFHNVETIDLMGPLLARLSQQLSISPAEKPGLFRQLNKEYFRRIETMEFALHHDDGRRVDELNLAEIVLVGVSRTFKTPRSVYLAFRGWFVANVPIILNKEPPSTLLELPAEHVFGLTIDPGRLAELRQVRHERWGRSLGDYANPDFVQHEVAYAEDTFSSHPEWPVIEVTDKPIEEITAEILALMEEAQEQRYTEEHLFGNRDGPA
jgi:regulator of PEP synthase PpsR (kinase-PPPase family)